MLYFQTLPKILTNGYKGNALTLTNIMARSEIIPSLLNNPALFYKYDIQEGDTPEIVAAKYYGDSYRYWLVLFANQITDPQWDWPLNSKEFDVYMENKYASDAANANSASVLSYTLATPAYYQQTLTTVDNTTLNTTITNTRIGQYQYNTLVTGANVVTFPDGTSSTQTISKSIISIYDSELSINEGKRNINLINSVYASEIESQLKSLMRT